MNEIITEWTGPQGSGLLTIMYFEGGALEVAPQRAAVATFLSGVDNYLSNSYSWSVRTEGRVVNASDGALTGVWVNGAALIGTGSLNDPPVPDAAQVLVRWPTAAVVNGRRVQGRTFLPGLSRLAVVAGNLGADVAASIAARGEDLVDEGVGFGVWHRPSAQGAGSHHLATACSVWRELAVQRGRRQ